MHSLLGLFIAAAGVATCLNLIKTDQDLRGALQNCAPLKSEGGMGLLTLVPFDAAVVAVQTEAQDAALLAMVQILNVAMDLVNLVGPLLDPSRAQWTCTIPIAVDLCVLIMVWLVVATLSDTLTRATGRLAKVRNICWCVCVITAAACTHTRTRALAVAAVVGPERAHAVLQGGPGRGY